MPLCCASLMEYIVRWVLWQSATKWLSTPSSWCLQLNLSSSRFGDIHYYSLTVRFGQQVLLFPTKRYSVCMEQYWLHTWAVTYSLLSFTWRKKDQQDRPLWWWKESKSSSVFSMWLLRSQDISLSSCWCCRSQKNNKRGVETSKHSCSSDTMIPSHWLRLSTRWTLTWTMTRKSL